MKCPSRKYVLKVVVRSLISDSKADHSAVSQFAAGREYIISQQCSWLLIASHLESLISDRKTGGWCIIGGNLIPYIAFVIGKQVEPSRMGIPTTLISSASVVWICHSSKRAREPLVI